MPGSDGSKLRAGRDASNVEQRQRWHGAERMRNRARQTPFRGQQDDPRVENVPLFRRWRQDFHCPGNHPNVEYESQLRESGY
jgi:hypothetical protein